MVQEFEDHGELTVEVRADRILEAARALKNGPSQFTLLSGVTCADFPDEPGRFRLAYHLRSVQTGGRVRLRAWAGGLDPQIDSVTSVWPGADWQEREVFDLYGVLFDGHPDLRRILMWDGFKDYPMRKDYVEPDDYEYEPTPHDEVLARAKAHQAAREVGA